MKQVETRLVGKGTLLLISEIIEKTAFGITSEPITRVPPKVLQESTQ
jgi:hypothetical protein